MHLYLIRHGESEMNLPEWSDPGVYDVGLTKRGHKQAKALGRWVKGRTLAPNVIYCSTLRRTRETASYIEKSLRMTAVFDDRIREIGNNMRDHSPISAESPPNYQDFWASEQPFQSITSDPNGENLLHFRARIGMFLEEMLKKHADEVIYVVCHGYVIDAFFDLIYNVGHDRRVEVWTSNTGVIHLQHRADAKHEKWRIHYMNRIEHLKRVGGLGLTANGPDESWQE